MIDRGSLLAGGLLPVVLAIPTVAQEDSWWPTDLPPRVATALDETAADRDARMAWWREARFGMFIHWGLYAIPSGTWNGKRTGGAEWILNAARIHPDEYMPLQSQFDPVEFDATQWAMIARNAGMKYLVITSKHHDGFCLWPSEHTDFDVEGTPFKRDILGELAEACRREGIVLCFYHSIMDWTHPDYLPRRAWDDRPTDDADFRRYVDHMQAQVEELVDRYRPAVLWFDGEWESTWTRELGAETYDLVRTADPAIIVNNRVDVGREGMAGLTREGGYRGDFGTPEQEIPATGLPEGVDWETCMTMNRSWGHQSFDTEFKSVEDLVRKLVDIASKGGNFLLNVGPDARGRFPAESIVRLAAIGEWMDANAESIRGTRAGCFESLPWGRCTRRRLPDGNERLYLHVFERPESGVLRLPGLMNRPLAVATGTGESGAYLLADPGAGAFAVRREGADLVIALPPTLPDAIDTVVVLDLEGEAVVVGPPVVEVDGREIEGAAVFVERATVSFDSPSEAVEIRVTLDGSEPGPTSRLYAGPIELSETTTIAAACFLDGTVASATSRATVERVEPKPAVQVLKADPGLAVAAYLGEWTAVPEFASLEPVAAEVVETISVDPKPREEGYALRFMGLVEVPATGVWTFHLTSDDGSVLRIDGDLVVDNDGLHSATTRSGRVALERGLHRIEVGFFEAGGQDDVVLEWTGPETPRQSVPTAAFFH
jgi:alpha-L-fucosidase